MSSSTSKMPAITQRQTMRGHTSEVRGVVHVPGEQHIITCSVDGSLRLWDLESGAQIGEDWRDGNDAVWSMALSPDGKTIASGGDDEKVRLWSVETRKVIAKWIGHSDVVCAMCWSADGKRVVSGSWDGTARVWDVKRGKTNSSKLATGGDEEDAVKIWDAKTGELLETLQHHDYDIVRSLAWTSDGKKLIISGSYGPIRIFDTATWQEIAILEGHTRQVSAISLSQNNLLASVSLDKTARLWNLHANLPVLVGPPLQHEKDLRSVALSPDGKVLVTACGNNNVYTWDVHAILTKASPEGLLLPIDDSGIHHTPRSSLDDKSFLEADATRCPGEFNGVDELSPTFFAGMEVDADSPPVGGAHPHSSVNALLAHFSLLLHRFRPHGGETTELPQPSRLSGLHPHALLARLSSLIHRSPPENIVPNELQQPSTPSRVDPRVLLARLSSLFPRPRLGTDEQAEAQPTTPSSSRPDALISWLSPVFRSRTYTNEELSLTQRPGRPPVVEVAAVRDKQALVVARGPQFKKAKRAYEQQTQSHSQAKASSSHTQPASALTSATLPALGTAAAQPLPITWRAQIVLFLCCVSPPHTNGH